MKKFLCGLIIGVIIASSASAFAGQALRLVVNGEDITAQAAPIIIDGRTLVPARALAEKLGATVTWDGVNGTVVVKKEVQPEMQIDENYIRARDLHDTYGISFRVLEDYKGFQLTLNDKSLVINQEDYKNIDGQVFVKKDIVDQLIN